MGARLMRQNNWESLLGEAIQTGCARRTPWETPDEWVWDTLGCMVDVDFSPAAPVQVATVMGWLAKDVRFAQRGDLVVVGSRAGLVGLDGRTAWCPRDPTDRARALMAVPLHKIDQCWGVC